jgi:hypothetical protein
VPPVAAGYRTPRHSPRGIGRVVVQALVTLLLDPLLLRLDEAPVLGDRLTCSTRTSVACGSSVRWQLDTEKK